MLCGDLNEKEIHKRRDICIHKGFPGSPGKESTAMQELIHFHCTVETNFKISAKG